MEGTAGNIEIGKVRAHRTWEEGVVVDVMRETPGTLGATQRI